MKAVISTQDLDGDSLVRRAREWPGLLGRDMVQEVTAPAALPLDRAGTGTGLRLDVRPMTAA